jgi:lysophospholipid acyltransferase (LPLAT)-like uncharacterized protein
MTRVDTVAWPLKPLFWIYGYGLGLLLYSLCALTRATCRIELDGLERLSDVPDVIFAMWHQENLPSFVANFFRLTGRRFVLLNHPHWSMKPVHVILACLGATDLVLGSTGQGGREAALQLAARLKGGGLSTHINPDGPAGPPRVAHKGVAHLALQTGLPVVTVRFLCDRQLVLKRTWDGKRIPLPFSRLRVVFGRPTYVADLTFNEDLALIAKSLG